MDRAIALLVVLALASPARADNDGPSPDAALGLSLGISAGGAGLIVPAVLLARSHPLPSIVLGTLGAGALLTGPAFGHLYAGERSATVGLVLEVSGLAVAVVGGAIAAGVQCGISDKDSAPACTPTAAYALAIVGGAAVLTGFVWDLATVRSAARRHQAIAFGPVPLAGGGGLSIAGRF